MTNDNTPGQRPHDDSTQWIPRADSPETTQFEPVQHPGESAYGAAQNSGYGHNPWSNQNQWQPTQQYAAPSQPRPEPVPPEELYAAQQPQYAPAPAPTPQKQKGNGVVIALLSLIVLLLLGIAGWLAWDSGIFDRSPAQSERPTVVETVVVPPSPAAQDDNQQRASKSDLPNGASQVGQDGQGKFSSQAVGSSVTSEAFTLAVGDAFRAEYNKTHTPPTTVRAYSPITKQNYTMTCKTSNNIAKCTGGNNAVVYVW